jgi:hypothetical protein
MRRRAIAAVAATVTAMLGSLLHQEISMALPFLLTAS